MYTVALPKMYEKPMNLLRPDTSLNRTFLLSPVGVRINQVLLYYYKEKKLCHCEMFIKNDLKCFLKYYVLLILKYVYFRPTYISLVSQKMWKTRNCQDFLLCLLPENRKLAIVDLHEQPQNLLDSYIFFAGYNGAK